MRVVQEADPQEYIGVIGIQLGKYFVEWECSNNCMVWDDDDLDDCIDVPWMPFDITEDQLKLYLTFS